MSVSMHEATIPVLVRNLNNLSGILELAAKHAEDKEIDPDILINARLFLDMFPLSRQVQITSDVSKGAAARLAGIDAPGYEDDESTFDELQERIKKTIAFLESVTAEQIDGSEEREITLQAGPNEYTFSGRQFVQHFVFPNVFFHAATAYNILRHNGVAIGKMDWLGAGRG